MKRLFSKLINIIAIIFLTLYFLVWSLSSMILKDMINEHGLPDGFSLTSNSSVRYNPFLSHLTISDLAIKPKNKKVTLTLKTLEAELHLHQLLFDTLYIAEFKLDGLYIPAQINGSTITIAGIDPTSDDTDHSEKKSDKDNKAFAYKVLVPKITLTNVVIDLEHLDNTHRIVLDSLLLEDILFSQDQQNINVRLKSKINQAPLNLELNSQLVQQLGVVNVEVSIDEFSLEHAQPFIPKTLTALEGKVSYASKFNIELAKDKTQVNINKLLLAINQLHAKQDNVAIDIESQTVASNDLAITRQADSKVNVSGILTSTSHNIALELDEGQQLDIEKIAINDVSVALVQEAAKTQINIENFLLALNNLHVEQDNLVIDVASQDIESNDVSIALVSNTAPNISATLRSSTNTILVKSLLDDSQLANISGIDINELSVALVENSPLLMVASVNINDSIFSKQVEQEIPALASFKQLSINNISYQHQANKISVKDITLAGLMANILLDENKQLSTLVSLNANAKELATSEVNKRDKTKIETESDTTTSTTDAEPTIGFSLDKFTIVEGADIQFKDMSVSPSYERDILIDVLSLSAIDTTKPELESLLKLQGKSEKYANFDVNGRGFLFAKEQKYNIDAVMKEVSLPSVSSYIKDALKFEIESGQLDLNVKAALKGKKITGKANVLLRGIEFTKADNHETGTIVGQTSIPFNVALGMLKDSDGNVELALPLSGDTSSPSFGLSGLLTLLVKQATMSAAKDYLITTFVPYASVMKVAMAAGEYALKLRINDLTYLPQQIELNEEQIEFSRQMSVMLEDRSDINVKLCAIAIPQDIGLDNGDDALLEDNVKRLQAISTQRVDSFKSYMVEKLKVPSAKLLRCTPQVDTSKNAKARIEFVI